MRKRRYCIDCNKIIKRWDAQRCKKCYGKSISGNKNSIFKPKPICVECSKELSKYTAKRCKSCSKKGKLNPTFGKTNKWGEHTAEAKRKIREGNIGKQRSKDYINWLKENHPLRGKHHTDKTKLKMSKKKRGKNNPHYGKPPTHGYRIYYKGICMRSSWEVAYARYLNRNYLKWLYESRTFDLGDMTYIPDFYLPKTNEYIEIKGYWRGNAKKKFNLFKKLYPNIKISLLQKKELGLLKVI